MKHRHLIFAMCALALVSCKKNERELSAQPIKISKMHDICVSVPGVTLKSHRNGPDFVYGVISSRAGGEVAYYVSTEPSAVEDMRTEKVLDAGIRIDGILAYREKFSNGEEAILLSGYLSGFENKSKVDVRYSFDAEDALAKSVANDLALTTRNCKAG